MTLDEGLEKRLTAYVLGELSDTEKAGVEAQFFQDDSLFESLNALEEGLCRDYVADRLSPCCRAGFERQLSADVTLRAKVKESELLRELAVRERGRNKTAAPRWWQRPWTVSHLVFAGAFALALAAGVWVLERGPSEIRVTLSPGTLQGGSTQQYVEIPWGAGEVRLDLLVRRLPPLSGSRAVLRDDHWHTVWAGATTATGNGVEAILPAGRLSVGHYSVTLSLASDTVETYSFEVVRK